MSRILLLGATGFIGQHVLNALKADPRTGSVVGLGRKYHQPKEGQEWVQLDLMTASTADIAKLLEQVKPDAIINCMGTLTGSLDYMVEANIGVVAKLIEAIKQAAPRARLVKLGSAGEYGVVSEGKSVSEADWPRPVGAYGVTRLASTQMVALETQEGRLNGIVLRVFNPVGSRLPAENMLGRAALNIKQAIAQNQPYIQMGPLGAYRDFVDARDVGRAIALAALAPQPALEHTILNVASGKAVPSRELVHLLVSVSGYKGEIREGNPPPARSAGVNWIQGDIHLIEQALGWKPQYSLRESVEDLWSAL
jgi:nucleoside-diphosphate-sugar epimerase